MNHEPAARYLPFALKLLLALGSGLAIAALL